MPITLKILRAISIMLLWDSITAVNMKQVEMQWIKAIKLSQQKKNAEAVTIFKTISWELEEFSITLEKNNADQIETANSVILDIALAYSQASKSWGYQLYEAGNIAEAISAFKTAVACCRAMLNQRRLYTSDNMCVNSI